MASCAGGGDGVGVRSSKVAALEGAGGEQAPVLPRRTTQGHPSG